MKVSLKAILGAGPIPKNKSRAITLLQRLGVGMERMPVRGGHGFFVQLADLPEATRAALAAVEHGAEPAAESVDLRCKLAKATTWMRGEAERRVAALAQLEELLAAGMRVGEARGRVAAEHGVTPETLRDWHSLVRERPRSEWLPRLLPNHARTGRKAEMDEGLWRDCLSLLRHTKLPLKAAWRRTGRIAEKEGKAWPSYDALRARYNALHPQQQTFIEHGPKAQARMIPGIKRDRGDIGALEIVSIDARLVDVFVDREDGTKPKRIWHLAMVDVGTGKDLATVFAEEESEHAYLKLIKIAVNGFGWFDEVEVDNTKAAKGGNLERLLRQFGVKVHRVTPYRGQAKIVERSFRNYAEQIDPLFGAAYCGKSAADKPERHDPKAAVPLTEFHRRYEEEIALWDAEHRGIFNGSKDGKTNDERFAEKFAQRARRMPTGYENVLLASRCFRVTPNKETYALKALGNEFYSPECHKILEKHCGRRHRKPVWLFVDPENVQAGGHVQDESGNPLVDHVPCWVRSGYRDVESAKKGEAAKKRALKSARDLELANATYVAARYGAPPMEPSPAVAASNVITPANRQWTTQTAARKAKDEHTEAQLIEFRRLLDQDDRKRYRDEFGEVTPLGERGGVAAPPAQSATRAEPRTARRETA